MRKKNTRQIQCDGLDANCALIGASIARAHAVSSTTTRQDVIRQTAARVSRRSVDDCMMLVSSPIAAASSATAAAAAAMEAAISDPTIADNVTSVAGCSSQLQLHAPVLSTSFPALFPTRPLAPICLYPPCGLVRATPRRVKLDSNDGLEVTTAN